MDNRCIARELLVVARELEAADGMRRDVANLRRHHTEMSKAISALDALFHYKIVGGGAKDTLTGEPTLTDKERREAERAWSELEGVRQGAERMWDQIRVLERGVGRINDFMQYT